MSRDQAKSRIIHRAHRAFRRAIVAGCLLGAIASARTGAAAVTMVFQRVGSEPATMYADGDHLRVDNPGGGDETSAVIIDASGRKISVLNAKAKTYTEITEADMKRMRTQIDAMRAQMAAQLKNMPPEQRKQMERQMGPLLEGDKTRALTFKSLGQKKTVNGMPCEMYKVMQDGKLHEEDCILSWNAGLVKKSDFAGVMKFGQSMTQTLGLGAGQSQMMQLDRYPGLPISRVPLDEDGKPGPAEEVKSIKQGSVPASHFVVPKDFTKKELPQMGGMGAGGPPPRGNAPPPGATPSAPAKGGPN